MEAYRSLATQVAIQYKGVPIPDVTCEATDQQRLVNGCDPSRMAFPHVHTRAVGGLTVLTLDCWIMPEIGGPFVIARDEQFRAHFEVPEPVVEPIKVQEPVVEHEVIPVEVVPVVKHGVIPPVVTEPVVAPSTQNGHASKPSFPFANKENGELKS